MTVAEAIGVLPRRMSGWAAQASLAPNSLTGISVSLGVCAAVWFTAGTRWGNLIGAAALCGSYLAGRAAAGQPEVAVSESRLAGLFHQEGTNTPYPLSSSSGVASRRNW